MNDGSAEWLSELGSIIAALDGPAIQEGCGEWATQEVEPEARRLVPKLTRATERSIGSQAGPGGVVVFAGTHYSRVIEFGAGNRMANPFLMPALVRKLPLLGDYINRAVRRRIR